MLLSRTMLLSLSELGLLLLSRTSGCDEDERLSSACSDPSQVAAHHCDLSFCVMLCLQRSYSGCCLHCYVSF